MQPIGTGPRLCLFIARPSGCDAAPGHWISRISFLPLTAAHFFTAICAVLFKKKILLSEYFTEF
jgi:hypothetical protein